MDDAIALLEAVAIAADGNSFPLKVLVGRPHVMRRVPGQIGDMWVCPISIEPLYPDIGPFGGVDSFQALCNGISAAVQLLRNFVKTGGRLTNAEGKDIPLSAYGWRENS
jgi:hypothetical protein